MSTEPVLSQPSGSPELDLVDLAQPIVSQVEILGVRLIESEVKLVLEKLPPNISLDIEHGVTNVLHLMSKENQKLFVRISLEVKSIQDVEASGDLRPLFIAATFLLVYEVKDFSKIDDNIIMAFCVTNGTFNVWPYWREYVQSTTARMGIPPILIPVLRAG